MSKAFQNYIDGKWCASSDGATFENRNPAHWNELIGSFPLSTIADVDRAVAAAKKAYVAWRLVPAPGRGDIIRRAG